MRVGVVILNYNSYELTTRLIESIGLIEQINNIVIVDNCSTNTSYCNLIKLCNSKIDVIRTKKNSGYSVGNNTGCRYIIEKYRSDIIIISNPDVIFDENYVISVCRALEENKEYAAVTGLMYYPDGQEDKRQYLLLPKYWEDVFDCFSLGRKIVKLYLDSNIRVSKEEKINKVEALPGSLFAVRTSDFVQIGMFDENTFLYYEENILGKKIQKLGKNMGLLTNCRYVHDHAATISKYVKLVQKRRIINKSVLYYEKCCNDIRGLKLVILKIMLKLSLVDAWIVQIIKNMRKRK